MTDQIHFDDVVIGAEIPTLAKGPLTPMHLMRWSAALENWHRIHYDKAFAQHHEHLPDLVVNGSLKQQFIVQALKNWAGTQGWVWRVKFSFRAMNVVGETLKVWARVVETERLRDYGLVKLDTGIVNARGEESTPGRAIVALPLRNAPPVPYPFKRPQDATMTFR